VKIIQNTQNRMVLRDFSWDTFITGLFAVGIGLYYLSGESNPFDSIYGFIISLPFSLFGPFFSGIFLTMIGLFLLSRAPITSVTLDRTSSTCSLMGAGLTKFRRLKLPFKDIKSIAMEADFYESRFKSPMLAYYLALNLKDGKKLNLRYASMNLNETGRKAFDALMVRVHAESKQVAGFIGIPVEYVEPPEMRAKLPAILSKMK
jgi:hypothetical protein